MPLLLGYRSPGPVPTASTKEVGYSRGFRVALLAITSLVAVAIWVNNQSTMRVFQTFINAGALVAYLATPALSAPLAMGLADAVSTVQQTIQHTLEPRVGLPVFQLPNKLGALTPIDLGNGALRLTIPYAQAPLGDLRFANPQPLQNLSTGFDASKPPPSCYQGTTAPRGGADPSEDCLYMIAYVPKSINTCCELPILVWLPGGSFIGGSASADGLDGATLAKEQNMIVVVAQYRLGAFGWLQTGSTADESAGGASQSEKLAGNQAARDVTTALQFIHDNFGAFGGDTSKVTLSGQSSGAQMVRSLLTVPSASPLFQQAILVSDTQDYGPATQDSQNKLGEYVMQQLNCTDVACARAKSADDVLDASYAAYSDVPAADGSFPAGSPWRPAQGQWMSKVLEKDPAAAFDGAGKKLLLSTISNEAGAAVGNLFYKTAPQATDLGYAYADNVTFPLAGALDLFFNQGRGDAMMGSSTYAQEQQSLAGQDDGLRSMLETGATDGLWRCSTQNNARRLAQHGQVWLAEHMLGYTYPSNAGIDYCMDATKHCHEDDIYLIFGTLPSDATQAQQAFSQELRARWGTFVHSGSPNAASYTQWSAIDGSTGSLNMLLGGSGANGSSTMAQQQRPEVCGALWGSTVRFDWQMYS
ncbi:unnamed protein product [Parajaminaea phylloscopi]